MARPDVLLPFLLLIATIALAQGCLYTFKIKTGTKDNAGTDSVIGVKIGNQLGQSIQIQNLETWGGVMEEGHDYYENGNLDYFTAEEPCLLRPVCHLTLESDNSGENPGWYVEYVNVTTARRGFAARHQHFRVEQWLAVDEPPNELFASRDNCRTVGFEIRKSPYSIV